MCNCKKQVTKSECDELRRWYKSGLFIIYNISDDEGLRARFVPNGGNPNTVALEAGFLGADGEPEWYHVSEHPCNNT